MLYGDRIRLRAFEREDIPMMLRWLNDPEVRQGLLFYAPVGRAEEERWFESRIGRTDAYFFAIETLVDTGGRWAHIGNVALHAINWKNRHAGMALVIGEKDHWSRGFGTEATRVMLHFAFCELNLHRVELEVFDFNVGARRVYEKAGFRLEGTRRQAFYQEGCYHDIHMMGLLRDEYDRTDAGEARAHHNSSL